MLPLPTQAVLPHHPQEFSRPLGPSACSEADVTPVPSSAGDSHRGPPLLGIPDHSQLFSACWRQASPKTPGWSSQMLPDPAHQGHGRLRCK